MLLGISGRARAGKTTLATLLAAEFQKREFMNFVCLSFGTGLKNDLIEMFNLSSDQIYGNLKEAPDRRYPKPDGLTYWTPREMMQEYGQWCRKIDKDHWIKRVFSTIEKLNIENIIIDDIRQRNELQTLLDKGGYHIRIVRKDSEIIANPNHETEKDLDDGDYRIDFFIDNSGNLNDLKEAAIGIVKALITLDVFNRL